MNQVLLRNKKKPHLPMELFLVEVNGLEPLTLCL